MSTHRVHRRIVKLEIEDCCVEIQISGGPLIRCRALDIKHDEPGGSVKTILMDRLIHQYSETTLLGKDDQHPPWNVSGCIVTEMTIGGHIER